MTEAVMLSGVGDAEPLEPILVSAYEQFTASKARGNDPSAGSPFDPTSSPLYERAIFLIGAPRSGTTWLQQLLALHPSIATAGEMHVFCEGVGTLFDNHEGTDRYSGLSGWVTRPELVTLVRALVDGLMLRLRDTSRPAATHVLDKTPNHVPYAARLAETYPDAAYVHIIRDGRAAAASAQRLWSHSADYRTAARNVSRWHDAVLDCRRHLAAGRYVEVRYEDLLADTVGGLGRIYDVIGLPYDERFLARCAEFASLPINVSPSGTAPTTVGPELPADAEREMLLAAGDLLVELGYVQAAHRDRVLRHRSLRRTAREGAQLGRAAAARLRSVASRWSSEERAQRQRMQVRRQARLLADALAAGHATQAAAALSSDATLEDAAVRVAGGAAVAAYLQQRVEGLRETSLDVDRSTAVLRWAGGGVQQLHRLSFDAHSRIVNVRVETAGEVGREHARAASS